MSIEVKLSYGERFLNWYTEKGWAVQAGQVSEFIGGIVAEELASVRAQLERLTESMTDHPQWYDGPCRCHECMSYGASDGEP